MYNNNFTVDGEFPMKTLTKKRLLSLIKSLPDNVILGANQVQNINIYQKGKTIGYICTLNETINLYDKPF